MPLKSRNRKGEPRYVHPLEMEPKVTGSSVDIAGMRRRIAELEEMLAAATQQEQLRRKAKQEWILPEEPISRPGRKRRRLTKQEQLALARERRRHILISLGLLIMLIGLLNWLAQLLRA